MKSALSVVVMTGQTLKLCFLRKLSKTFFRTKTTRATIAITISRFLEYPSKANENEVEGNEKQMKKNF